jgi:radical SAM protein with 4Fe4S-binding SPASM domain
MFPPPVCSAGKSGLTITPEGYMIPCLGCRTKPGSRTPDAKYILGRYRLEPPDFLRHVWNTSPVLKMFRDLTPDKLKGDCKHCTELTRCKGGCPIRREIQTGDVATGPDYKCIMPLLLQG